MALLGFQNVPLSLDVKEAFFKEEQGIPNTREYSKALVNGADVGNEV